MVGNGCPKIKIYWKEILKYIKEITNIEIPENHCSCLFHGVETSIRQYRDSVIPHMMNAVKSLIPKKWKEIENPKVRDWLSRVKETYMEYVRYSSEENREGFLNIWGKWKRFKLMRRSAEATIS